MELDKLHTHICIYLIKRPQIFSDWDHILDLDMHIKNMQNPKYMQCMQYNVAHNCEPVLMKIGTGPLYNIRKTYV